MRLITILLLSCLISCVSTNEKPDRINEEIQMDESGGFIWVETKIDTCFEIIDTTYTTGWKVLEGFSTDITEEENLKEIEHKRKDYYDNGCLKSVVIIRRKFDEKGQMNQQKEIVKYKK